MNRYVLVGLIALVLVIAVFQMTQINGLKSSISGAAAAGGETYEQMMARMHPEQAAATGGMVGGC